MSTEKDISRVRIKLILENIGEAEGELVRFKAPRTIDMIVHKFPISGRIALYKEEIYFEIPIKMGKEKAKPTVETGTIAFWPMGNALCIFYGNSQPYSPVNVLGQITKNLDIFKTAKSGAKIKVELLLPNTNTNSPL